MQLMTTTSAISLQYAVFRNIKMTEKPMVSKTLTKELSYWTVMCVGRQYVPSSFRSEIMLNIAGFYEVGSPAWYLFNNLP